MTSRLYTEEELAEFRSMPKRVTNPRARWSTKPKARPAHRQRSFQVLGGEDEETRFLVYQRENLADESDFSCGIAYLPYGGPPLTLSRYNGPAHEHGDLRYRTHIHQATERAIEAGKKPESEAEETDRFETIEGALACLIEDFDIVGIKAEPDAPDMPLFPPEVRATIGRASQSDSDDRGLST
jgi:hypothetical protein